MEALAQLGRAVVNTCIAIWNLVIPTLFGYVLIPLVNLFVETWNFIFVWHPWVGMTLWIIAAGGYIWIRYSDILEVNRSLMQEPPAVSAASKPNRSPRRKSARIGR